MAGKKRNFYFTDKAYKELKYMARANGHSLSTIIRLALADYWKKFQREARDNRPIKK